MRVKLTQITQIEIVDDRCALCQKHDLDDCAGFCVQPGFHPLTTKEITTNG